MQRLWIPLFLFVAAVLPGCADDRTPSAGPPTRDEPVGLENVTYGTIFRAQFNVSPLHSEHYVLTVENGTGKLRVTAMFTVAAATGFSVRGLPGDCSWTEAAPTLEIGMLSRASVHSCTDPVPGEYPFDLRVSQGIAIGQIDIEARP